MPIISASVDSFLFLSAALVVPTLIFSRGKPRPLESPHRRWFSAVLLLHTLYILYVLMLKFPPNLFQRLHIPLTMPSDSIRTILLQKAGLDSDAPLPKPLEDLLTKLSSFELRTLYVRFGQAVLQDCGYCSTYDEFSLYALPGILLEYIREASFLGLLTINGSHRERWRTYAIVALVCAGVLEGYTLSAQTIRVPRDGQGVFMLHDNLWFCRQLAFLILPVLVHITGPVPPPPIDPASALREIQGHLQSHLSRLTSLKYLRGAVMRDPTLRAASSEWWDEQRVVGAAIREDGDVQKLAEGFGYGYVETREADGADSKQPKLKVNAKMAVDALKTGLAPLMNPSQTSSSPSSSST